MCRLTKSTNQPVVDPIRRSVPGGVRRVQSDASFQARSSDPLLPRGLSHALERGEDGRVVGHDHVHALVHCLLQDWGGQVVGQQQRADVVRGARLQQQTNVVPGTCGPAVKPSLSVLLSVTTAFRFNLKASIIIKLDYSHMHTRVNLNFGKGAGHI